MATSPQNKTNVIALFKERIISAKNRKKCLKLFFEAKKVLYVKRKNLSIWQRLLW
jgi:hypothetical protein